MNIASVADVKARLSAYVRKSQKGPVIVTRNGKPVAALIAVTDGDELERLVLAHSPKFQAILGKSRRQIEETGGIPHDSFWRSVADGAAASAEESVQFSPYIDRKLSPEQRGFLSRLIAKGFRCEFNAEEEKTLRIIDRRGKNRGYINPTVFRKHGIFGHQFDRYDYCLMNEVDEFRKKYGDDSKGGWIPHAHSKDPKKQHIVVTDIQLAYKILGVDGADLL